MELDIHGEMSQGERDYQEDCFEICVERVNQSESCLIVLCDGMGGHKGGALASNLVTANFVNTFVAQQSISPKEALKKSIEMAHKAVIDEISQNSAPSGMGTTIIAVYIENNDLHWLSVGDSHLYLVRDGKLKKLNEDHSMAVVLDELAEIGRISEEEASLDPQRNALRSCISSDEISMMDYQSKFDYLISKDKLILASDGLDTLSAIEVENVVRNNKNSESIAKQLISTVDKAKKTNQDNTSVVVISVKNKSWFF